VHVIGLPYHWGPAGVVTGDIANDLIGVALEPTVKIHEAKAFTCNLEKGRKVTASPVERTQEQALHAASPQGGVAEPADSEGADMMKGAPGAGA
jgi:formate dehydrogenase major subunit